MANQWELLGVLSHPTRQAILDQLRQGPCTVGELAAHLPVTRPAVSQHLQLLKSVGLVAEERRGTRHYFHLSPKSLAELRAHLDSLWRDALNAFSDFVREETKTHVASKKKTRAYSAKRSRRLPN
ncbi:MAG: winged helix-turn-helix transcriptional regulator [Acidobacteriaceae bacterium]|nr:winged helix-turn-helix transcriptional regulator [Acidobacteriaceae bacterium]